MKDSCNTLSDALPAAECPCCPWLHVWSLRCANVEQPTVPWTLPATRKKRNTATTAALLREAEQPWSHTTTCCFVINKSSFLLPLCGAVPVNGSAMACLLLQKTPESRVRIQKSGWTQWAPTSRNNLHSGSSPCSCCVALLHYQDHQNLILLLAVLKKKSRSWQTCRRTKNEAINTPD